MYDFDRDGTMSFDGIYPFFFFNLFIFCLGFFLCVCFESS